ncbi:MAG TPA: NRDE family protein [Thermoanaerobaculia bacterium]|nr:NRDE family protein [Thermoanaerobaculia bacterium]
MCLIILSWREDPQYPLVVAANRDELHERPTRPADWWHDSPSVLAGRDLVGGGTWMGVSASGRFAAVTNYRDGLATPPDGPSRGLLVIRFLRTDSTAAEFLAQARTEVPLFAPFNLFVCDGRTLGYLSSVQPEAEILSPGVHGLSNGLLDSRWPKVERGRTALRATLGRGAPDMVDRLFMMLRDTTRADDGELPDTGVGLELERDLSPMFIVSPWHGTRSSTVLLIRAGGEIDYQERAFDAEGRMTERRSYRFHTDGEPAGSPRESR